MECYGRLFLVLSAASICWGLQPTKCTLDPPSTEEYAYKGLPDSVKLEPPKCSSGQVYRGRTLHVLLGDDMTSTSTQNRGILCHSIRSSLFFNIKVKLFNKPATIRKAGKGSLYIPYCMPHLTTTEIVKAHICKPNIWLDMVEEGGVGDEDLVLIRDANDIIHGSGIGPIIERFERKGVDILMGTEGICGLTYFENRGYKGSPRSNSCEMFWKEQKNKRGSFINSGLLMGKGRHVKQWLRHVIEEVIPKMKLTRPIGDQSAFGVAFVQERSPAGAFPGVKRTGLSVDLDDRNLAILMSDTNENKKAAHMRGWSVSRNPSPVDPDHPFNVTREYVSWPPRPVMLHWAGYNVYGKKGMLCATRMNPSEGACFPPSTQICMDGVARNLSEICPTPWTMGCEHFPDNKEYYDTVFLHTDDPHDHIVSVKDLYEKPKPRYSSSALPKREPQVKLSSSLGKRNAYTSSWNQRSNTTRLSSWGKRTLYQFSSKLRR